MLPGFKTNFFNAPLGFLSLSSCEKVDLQCEVVESSAGIRCKLYILSRCFVVERLYVDPGDNASPLKSIVQHEWLVRWHLVNQPPSYVAGDNEIPVSTKLGRHPHTLG